MSLDAAHMKSCLGGTLYIATVKTACDEIFPVAFAITHQNEDLEGWIWFLRNLRQALPVLTFDHPRYGVQYKYFTFISDRQKGLIPALQLVFPDNHSCFCVVHIQRNVQVSFGQKNSKFVFPLARTFSTVDALELLNSVSESCREYLEEIEASHWRNTAWLLDSSLPPRYGILSSNISESSNNMFEESRVGTWLQTLDTTLIKMMERINFLRRNVGDKNGVVPKIVGIVKKRWENCAGFRVFELEENGSVFSVVRPARSATVDKTSYNIDVLNYTCDCGVWQDHGVPCIDGIAYYKLHEKLTVDQVLEGKIDSNYTYDNQRSMLSRNIISVCLNRLRPDDTALPPAASQKKNVGRPKNKRFRKRSRYAHDPESSSRSCSRCKMRGHNVRTCLAREREAIASHASPTDNLPANDVT
jgi:hypothetical protein